MTNESVELLAQCWRTGDVCCSDSYVFREQSGREVKFLGAWLWAGLQSEKEDTGSCGLQPDSGQEEGKTGGGKRRIPPGAGIIGPTQAQACLSHWKYDSSWPEGGDVSEDGLCCIYWLTSIYSKPGDRNSVQLLFISFKLINILHIYFKTLCVFWIFSLFL